jgi:hypothetical protein
MASAHAPDRRFDTLGGVAALAAALVSIVYAAAFVVLRNDLLASLALMAGGLLSAAALFAVYERVRGAGPLATLGLAFGFIGTIGAAVHGAYDLANVFHPPSAGLAGPHPIDPRGFLTFGVAGLGLICLSIAGLRVGGLKRPLLYLGLLLGAVLIVIYLGRLIVLDPASMLVLGPALVGAILSPIWYASIGYLLLTGRADTA